MITFRLVSSRYRIKELLDIMKDDEISTPEKMQQLIEELNNYHNTNHFSRCKSIGDIVKTNLKQTLRKNLLLVQKNLGKNSD